MKENQMLVNAFLALFLVAGSFWAGMQYQKRGQAGPQGQFGPRGMLTGTVPQGQNATRDNRTGFRPISGDIMAREDKTLTVKMADGSSKIVLLTDQTKVNRENEVTWEELKAGEKVMVMGQEGSEGAVTAERITLNPASLPNPQKP